MEPKKNTITQEHVLQLLASSKLTACQLGEKTTVVQVTLPNGFVITEHSSCVDPANFDMKIGIDTCRGRVIAKLWELEGYRLQNELHGKEERIARACHEVNRAYCEALGDASQPAWEAAPEWQRDSAMLGVKLHTENPGAGPQHSHESWMAQKLADGWRHGAVKNPVEKTHPCIVPFDELPPAQQAKDFIFRAVVHALS